MLADDIRNEVWNLIEPVIKEKGFELIKIEYNPGNNGLLRLIIDHENGISIDDCADVSRVVSENLDIYDPIKHSYMLEVSSPGSERPLTKKEHYDQFIGKKVKIRLKEPVNNQINITGILTDHQDGIITVVTDLKKQMRLMLNNIDKANLKDFK